MISNLSTDTHVPIAINQQINLANLGTPIRAFRGTLLQIMTIIFLFLGVLSFACILYIIYAYFNFISLTHLYPNIVDIPSNQLDYYSWMQVLHDRFWYSILQVSPLLLASYSGLSSFGIGFTTKIYVCIAGLLKIEKEKVETVRWDQVSAIYTTRGNITTIERHDKSKLTISQFFYRQQANRQLSMLIGDQIAQTQLPQLLERFDRGETVSLGNLEINKKGLYKSSLMLPWNAVGAVDLDKGHLRIYGNQSKYTSTKKEPSWHEWSKDTALHSNPPDLPLFATLVNTILELEQDSSQQARISHWKTTALQEKKARAQRIRLLIVAAIALPILLLAAMTYYIISYSNAQNQREARDLLLIQHAVKNHAQHPYYAPTPGTKCDQGMGNWVEDDSNTYDCLPDGLYMIQHNMQYQDEIYFDFDKATDATTDPQLLFTGQFVPHHYQLQVKATMVSGGPDTCVAVHFHIQQYMGRQEFDICADNTWSYYYCDLQCDNDVQVASGNLPSNETSPYLITVDVTDTVQTLYVDHSKITAIKDSRYTKTDNIALGVYGDENGVPSAVFADFRYTSFIQP